MSRPRALPPSLGPAFGVGEALAAGVHRERLRRGDLRTPSRGIRLRDDARWVDGLRAVLVETPGAVAFGPTAARLHGMTVPTTAALDSTALDSTALDSTALDSTALHLAVARPARAPRRSGVAGVSVGLGHLDLTRVDGIPVTTRPRTWVDLARVLPLAHLVAAADALCRPDAGDPCHPNELGAALTRAGRVRGAAVLRHALGLIDVGAESIPESLLRVAIVEAALPRPVANSAVYDGRIFVARVDLLFADFGVVVEYEGAHHATDLRQWRRDLTRIGELQRLGYLVERAHAADVADPAPLLARLATHLRRRGWCPTR